jgi:hypothetical protein
LRQMTGHISPKHSAERSSNCTAVEECSDMSIDVAERTAAGSSTAGHRCDSCSGYPVSLEFIRSAARQLSPCAPRRSWGFRPFDWFQYRFLSHRREEVCTRSPPGLKGCSPDHPAVYSVAPVARGRADLWRKVVPVLVGCDARYEFPAGRQNPPGCSPCGVSSGTVIAH